MAIHDSIYHATTKGKQISLSLIQGTSLAVDDIDYFDQLLYIKDPDGCLPRRFLNFNFTSMGSPFYYSLETDEYYDFYNCSNVRRLKTGEFGLVPLALAAMTLRSSW